MPSKKDLDRFRGDVGETVVAYELLKRGWDVMRNLGGHGYDLLASRARVQRRVEVKCTDPSRKTGRARNQLTVILSKSEQEAADFLVFYVHGFDTFFVIPRSAFPTSGSVTVFVGRDGHLTTGTAYERFKNGWSALD